jgi:hypothetical protein
MRIRRIEVKDFRKLGRAVVEDLHDGLNVLVGDNEAGKSTLLAALRTGLFERHRVGGKVAAAMQPYNQTVRPEIAIDFEIDGHLWHLRKAFCQRPEAELSGPGERTSGDAVEERLAQLFGFTPPGAGGSKPDEHQGVHGLLWVEQGRSHRALGIGASHDVIASALEQEIGHVVGGERGRALLTTAEERRNTFWDKRGNVRGDLKILGERVVTLRMRHDELSAILAAQDQRVAHLAEKREALARHVRERRLDHAATALEAARQAVVGSECLRAAHARALELLARRRLEHAGAATRWDGRTKLAAEATTEQQMTVSLGLGLSEAQEALARRGDTLKRAEAALAAARRVSLETANAVRRMELSRGRTETIDLLAVLRERLTAAQDLDATRRNRAAAASAIAIAAADIVALEALETERDRAMLQLDSASVRLSFDTTCVVELDGVSQDVTTPLLLSRDAVLMLQGFGQLGIRPGGGVEELARKTDEAERALAERLAVRAYIDVAAARAALAAKADAIREAKTAGQTLKLVAPEGIEGLLQIISEKEAYLLRSGDDILEWSPAALDAALQALAASVDPEKDAEYAVIVTRMARDTADRDVAALAERTTSKTREADGLVQSLDRARVENADAAVLETFHNAERALAEATDRESAAAAALADADPEAVGLELKRAEGAERAIRIDIETLKRESRDLDIELRALGRQGVGEEIAELEGNLAAEEARLDAQGRHARAARLLHETLAEAQRETRDRWLGPVRERAAPYLRLVQPNSDIVLNEDTLEIESIVRNGVIEPFGGLSVGAREQIAVITRLALAEILQSANRPSAIILDDALVNADEGRLQRMHLVLQRAAQRMQVLILTCRERDFVQLGAPIKRL